MKGPGTMVGDCAAAVKQYCTRVLHRDLVRLRSGGAKNGSVLLSYLTFPFRAKPDDLSFFSHTNTWECLQMAKTWLQHGYDVDVIDWDNRRFLPKKDYSVFIDIHANMERVAPLLSNDCRKILHITGAHWRFQNAAEMKRLSELEKRRGIRLQPYRQVLPSNGIEHADCATILGNAFTRGTFAYAKKPLYTLPLSTTIEFPFIERDYAEAGRNFLWMGSSGMVHRGLDLVLEAFSGLPDCRLTVCGPVSREPDFERSYFRELYRTDNIRTVGFVDLRSDAFHKVIRNTSTLLYPSCSEGQAGSVITCLHAGLIPAISHESGVDVNDFGFILRESSVREIKDTVRMVSQKPGDELRKMSENAWRYARENHTRKKFAECYEKFVFRITNGQDAA